MSRFYRLSRYFGFTYVYYIINYVFWLWVLFVVICILQTKSHFFELSIDLLEIKSILSVMKFYLLSIYYGYLLFWVLYLSYCRYQYFICLNIFMETRERDIRDFIAERYIKELEKKEKIKKLKEQKKKEFEEYLTK